MGKGPPHPAAQQTFPIYGPSTHERTPLHRASDTTHRLPRDQRERRERRDAHAREFSLFGEDARDVGDGGLVGRCGVWRSPVSGRSASFHGWGHGWGLTERDADVAAVDAVEDGCFVGDEGLLALQSGPVAVV